MPSYILMRKRLISISTLFRLQPIRSEGKNNTCTKQWVESEKEQLAEIMRGYGIEWENLGTHEQHLDVLEYKKKMRAKEVAVLENKVVCTQHQLENTERVLRDADDTLERLDKEYAEKSVAVEKLDSALSDKNAELSEVTDKLAVNQMLLQTSAEKVAHISDIDSISIKRSMIGDRITLSAEDYEHISDLAKKEIAVEHDSAEKDDEIYRLNEQLQKLNKERVTWNTERSRLEKTIDGLRAQVRELSNSLSSLKAKYAKVMKFIDSLGLKEKLDKFLHPIKNIKKHR